MKVELLGLEFTAESCFVYFTCACVCACAHTHEKEKEKKKSIVFPEGRKAQVISIKRFSSSPELESRLLGTAWLMVQV